MTIDAAYLPRLVDEQVDRALRSAGAVLIEGPKACGKTSTALRHARSEVRLDASPQMRMAGLTDPHVLLEGDVPRLIDEWQLVPDVWNAVRAAVDQREQDGQFILTGSATPADDTTRHSGAMRFARVRMHPMSLYESGDSTGDVNLRGLFADEIAPSAGSDADLATVAALVCRGGWPSNLRRGLDDAMRANHDYLTTVAATDIVTVDGVRRHPRKVAALLFALGRSSATYVTNRSLQQDTTLHGEGLSPKTLNSYLDALARLHLFVEQPAWGQHLRSNAQVRRNPKRHLVDPSLAAAAIGATPASLVADTEALGQLFESMAFRDLNVYAQAIDAQVFAYQDNRDAEIDSVIVKDADWIGLEVKLSNHPVVIDAAAAKLTAVADKMRTAPAALGVLTSRGPSYRRPDGVYVISLLALAP